MKGLELARAYWEACGLPMIREQFPEYEEVLMAGLTGSGSECYGFDDEVSQDHDFEPGFCLFLPGEEVVDRRTAFLLERAYVKLPPEFGGFRRQRMNPVGGRRHGVFRLEEYYTEKLGCPPDKMGLEEWLRLPEYALAEAVNGEVFHDPVGLLEDLRQGLIHMPEYAMRKRLAGHLLIMAQSGQYNYLRCLSHGERAAAQLAAVEFVRHAMAAIFLLSGAYMPFYKWSFRALRRLQKAENPKGVERRGENPDNPKGKERRGENPDGGAPWGMDFCSVMEELLTTGNDPLQAERKSAAMEAIAAQVIDALQAQGLTHAVCGDLEKHAYSVNDGIRESEIRNLHVLYCVS